MSLVFSGRTLASVTSLDPCAVPVRKRVARARASSIAFFHRKKHAWVMMIEKLSERIQIKKIFNERKKQREPHTESISTALESQKSHLVYTILGRKWSGRNIATLRNLRRRTKSNMPLYSIYSKDTIAWVKRDGKL